MENKYFITKSEADSTYVRMRSVISVFLMFFVSILSAVYVYGQQASRIDSLEKKVYEIKDDSVQVSKKLEKVQSDIAVLQNDIKWQGETLKLIARKLDVQSISKD